MISNAANGDLGEPSRTSEVSSAYCEILCSLLSIKIPFMSVFCFIYIARVSAQRINKYGTTGSSSLQPRCKSNYLDKKPLCSMVALKLVFKLFIH